ncbi:peptidoglycan recognition protein family protein [Enterococcus avium]|uniref:peptidoglycan recognition protein family protein n=1 Tax=Enterococcus avium TaxID=33945 RepID=UPI0032E439AC
MAGEVFSSLITSVNPKVMNSGSRGGCKIDRIILHHNATTNKDVAMNTWLVGGAAGTSAHYEITPTEIIGCVGEQYAAWHAGGTGPADPPRISNPNQRSIGIENVNSTGAPSWSLDSRTIINCAKLVADICKRYGIPCDRQHVLGHNEVTATACPGGMNVDEVVRQAQVILNGSAPAPSKPSTSAPTKTKKTKEGNVMLLFKENGRVYWLVGNEYTYINKTSELANIKTMMKKAGYDTWEHTNSDQVKYIKKIAKETK